MEEEQAKAKQEDAPGDPEKKSLSDMHSLLKGPDPSALPMIDIARFLDNLEKWRRSRRSGRRLLTVKTIPSPILGNFHR